MTPEAQRIAIAEACGWTNRPYLNSYNEPKTMWHAPDGTPIGFVPDYLKDLNAMHEAEKVLTDTHDKDQWSPYCIAINNLACGCGNLRTCGYTIAATAAQRAEAFLRTTGKWEDGA